MLPFIHIFNKTIPSYGICMLLGVALVVAITYFRTKSNKNFSLDKLLVLSAITFSCAIIFGMLVYILVTYSISYILNALSHFDFSFITSAGIVFYGGLFGGIIGCIIGGRILKFDIWSLETPLIPIIPLGHAIGRIGCLLSGCCYGIPYDGIFAISYPNSIFNLPSTATYFPVQALEAVLDILITLYLLHYTKKERKRFDILFCYLFLYAIMRFFTELLRGDSIRGLFYGLSTSQWISIFILIITIIRYLTLHLKAKTHHKSTANYLP